MAGRIQRIARGIDDVTRTVWDDSGTGVKLLILVVLVVTATAIPLVPLAILARYVANR
ncbi:hypothetical protein [Halorarum salinum]|uniref:Uncharacterized protein n=1 Tax=Halorarum salinum TaxID=2743089 RepID=A0A7D5L8D3_9EURY|nr:hypothetical protein [Halobaculum salinum]QLG60247.1 hypothetical protein HUG12_00060 [Halobaculum salinum]